MAASDRTPEYIVKSSGKENCFFFNGIIKGKKKMQARAAAGKSSRAQKAFLLLVFVISCEDWFKSYLDAIEAQSREGEDI